MSFPLGGLGSSPGGIHGPKGGAKSQTSGRQPSGRTRRDRETDNVERGEEKGRIDEIVINRFPGRRRKKDHKGNFCGGGLSN